MIDALCQECGESFQARNERIKFCDGCKRKHKLEYNRMNANAYNKQFKMKVCQETVMKAKDTDWYRSLVNYCKRLDDYNKVNKTRYSYGQAMQKGVI